MVNKHTKKNRPRDTSHRHRRTKMKRKAKKFRELSDSYSASDSVSSSSQPSVSSSSSEDAHARKVTKRKHRKPRSESVSIEDEKPRRKRNLKDSNKRKRMHARHKKRNMHKYSSTGSSSSGGSSCSLSTFSSSSSSSESDHERRRRRRDRRDRNKRKQKSFRNRKRRKYESESSQEDSSDQNGTPRGSSKRLKSVIAVVPDEEGTSIHMSEGEVACGEDEHPRACEKMPFAEMESCRIKETEAAKHVVTEEGKNGCGEAGGTDLEMMLRERALQNLRRLRERSNTCRDTTPASGASKASATGVVGLSKDDATEKERLGLEEKTMSVMRGGEMVKVSYKVFIPKKAPALARRQLQR